MFIKCYKINYYFNFQLSSVLLYFDFQVGTTTLLAHFSHLTDTIPAYLKRRLKSNNRHSYELLHNLVPGKFKVPSDLVEEDNNTLSNNKFFLKIFKQFLKSNNIMSFSFVRHPFERYIYAQFSRTSHVFRVNVMLVMFIQNDSSDLHIFQISIRI